MPPILYAVQPACLDISAMASIILNSDPARMPLDAARANVTLLFGHLSTYAWSEITQHQLLEHTHLSLLRRSVSTPTLLAFHCFTYRIRVLRTCGYYLTHKKHSEAANLALHV
jgi:hypothetical protein